MVWSDFSFALQFSRHYIYIYMLKFGKSSTLSIIYIARTPSIYFYSNKFCTTISYRQEFSPIYKYVRFYRKAWRKLHFTCDRNTTMLLMWYQTVQSFKFYFPQVIGRVSFCFACGGFVSLKLRIRGLSYAQSFTKFHHQDIIKNA